LVTPIRVVTTSEVVELREHWTRDVLCPTEEKQACHQSNLLSLAAQSQLEELLNGEALSETLERADLKLVAERIGPRAKGLSTVVERRKRHRRGRLGGVGYCLEQSAGRGCHFSDRGCHFSDTGRD
jgi:hypothetical protein